MRAGALRGSIDLLVLRCRGASDGTTAGHSPGRSGLSRPVEGRRRTLARSLWTGRVRCDVTGSAREERERGDVLDDTWGGAVRCGSFLLRRPVINVDRLRVLRSGREGGRPNQGGRAARCVSGARLDRSRSLLSTSDLVVRSGCSISGIWSAVGPR